MSTPPRASPEAVPPGTTVLLDTGPVLALVNRRDRHHGWTREVLRGFKGPLVTCEAVVSEAWFLAQRRLAEPTRLLDLVERLPLEVVPAWGPRAIELVRTYETLPMSVADAGLVVLAEREARSIVLTIDRRDFSVYRLRGSKAVPALFPPP